MVAGCFPRREIRQTLREVTEAVLMGLERINCWTLAEALGHCGPHRLQHFLSRAAWDHEAVRGQLAAFTVGHLADDQAVLVVDETGDEKSSTDAVGAARQYSGALGGIGLAQVAVHLTYAGRSGHALIDRALYLTKDWAADDERREPTGVPDDLAFATKPQLAADLPSVSARPGCRLAGWPPTRSTADKLCESGSASSASTPTRCSDGRRERTDSCKSAVGAAPRAGRHRSFRAVPLRVP